MTAYLGAQEAQALIGAWQQLGSDVQIRTNPGDYYRGRRDGDDRRRGRHRDWDDRRERDRDRDRDYGYGYQPYAQPYAQPYTPPAYAPPAAYYNVAPRAPRPNAPAFAPAFQQPFAPVVRDHRGQPPMTYHGARVGAELGGGEGPQPRAWLREMPEPDMANRQVLPMNTGTTPVPQNSTAQITSRPQRVAFRPERVFVSASDIGGSGSAANWIINDITIGNRSQFAQSGALPGDMFSSVAIDSFVTFETAQTAMDVVMIVTYQGATEGGTPFYGSIIGTAAV